MQTLYRYQARDGTTFCMERECRAYEAELRNIEALLRSINPGATPGRPIDGSVPLPAGTRKRLADALRASVYATEPRHADNPLTPYRKAWEYWACISDGDRLYPTPYDACLASDGS